MALSALCIYGFIMLAGVTWLMALAIGAGLADGVDSALETAFEALDGLLEGIGIDLFPDTFGIESARGGGGVAFGAFLVTLGGSGLVLTSVWPGVSGWLVIILSIIFSLIAFVVVIGIFIQIHNNTKANMVAEDADFIGLVGTLTVGIPQDGAGSVPLKIRGQTLDMPCRSAEKALISRGTLVRVVRKEGPFVIVTPVA